MKAGSEQGVALVAVLWTLAILSLIAAAILTSATLAYRTSRNTSTRVQAAAYCDAGIVRGILGVLDRRPEQRWRVDGTAYEIPFEGAKVSVRVEDELGKIDINEADRELLKRLLVAVGVETQHASDLAARIVDWRTRGPASQDSPSSNGFVPRHGPFQSVDELELVGGITPDLFARLKPSITVYSNRPVVETATAPAPVLAAYEGLDLARAKEMVAERESAALSDSGGAVVGTKLNPAFALADRALTVEANASRGLATCSRSTVIRLTGNPSKPYLVLDRR